MRTNMRIILFLLIVLTIFSCEKPTEELTCEINTINFDNDPNEFFKLKKENNKIVELISAKDPTTKRVYTFNDVEQLVLREDFTNIDNLGEDLVRSRYEYEYDISGDLVKTTMYSQSYSGGVALGLGPASFYFFEYTSGHVSKIKSYSDFNGTSIYQGETVFTWANDDLVFLNQMSQTGQSEISIKFTYDLNTESKIDSIAKNFYLEELVDRGHALAGIRRSKHVLTSAIQKWVGSPEEVINYVTRFNKKGYITSIQEKTSIESNYVFRFDYLCK